MNKLVPLAIAGASILSGCAAEAPKPIPATTTVDQFASMPSEVKAAVLRDTEMKLSGNTTYTEYATQKVGETTLHYATLGTITEEGRMPADIHAKAFSYFTETAKLNSVVDLVFHDRSVAENKPPVVGPPLSTSHIGKASLSLINKDNYIMTFGSDVNLTVEGSTPGQSVHGVTFRTPETPITITLLNETDDTGQINPSYAAVEACQASTLVEVTNAQELAADAYKLNTVAQEQYCNALGNAYTYADIVHVPYEAYRSSIVTYVQPLMGADTKVGEIPIVNQDLYAQITAQKPAVLNANSFDYPRYGR